ncbi:AAA-domain-containing protein [Zopfia rhizophila CBS 207.26]|uniref:AAA-domain-containing protein n=1 Tax=Zopfia rhizophila CBS 207.26 TaxID=1314779 RepID=A0A6A6DZH7_9PEZI|nr:AAA-domain-containing protein [Zopfia rhizophila CBS 207.26]
MSSLACSDFILCLKIADHSKPYTDDTFHVLSENHLEIAVYSLFQGDDEDFPVANNGDDSTSQFTVTQLPHKVLDGLWESLIYAERIPEAMLRIIMRMMKLSKQPHLNPAVIYWHNLVLLYGPPGSGKTTLAQALAQKLSIRLGKVYSATKLIEVNSHTLLSKWFGESSKLVGKLFETISSISADETLLTVVIIDEVETLAGSREKAAQSNECSDAIRSTNELLQGLDKLRKRPNVVFICTSNLKDNMDVAFVDRCGIKQFVETPNNECAYEIFRSVINELIKNGLVFFDASDFQHDSILHETLPEIPIVGDSSPMISNSSSLHVPSPSLLVRTSESYDSSLDNLLYIPELGWVGIHLFHCTKTAPRELWRIARKASGLSGRTLRRLPILAMAKYTIEEPCDLHELLAALKTVVKEENKAKFGDEPGPNKSKEHKSNQSGFSEDELASLDHIRDLSMEGLGEELGNDQESAIM